MSFTTDKSVRFDDSAQLVRLGLMRSEDTFEQSARMTQAAPAQQRAAGAA